MTDFEFDMDMWELETLSAIRNEKPNEEVEKMLSKHQTWITEANRKKYAHLLEHTDNILTYIQFGAKEVFKESHLAKNKRLKNKKR